MPDFLRRLVIWLANRTAPAWIRWVVAILGFLSAAFIQGFNQSAGGSEDSGVIRVSGLVFPTINGAVFFLIATIPNLCHDWIRNRANDRLKGSKGFFSNHDLTKAVGQSLRLILLDAADPRVGATSLSAAAATWVRARAHTAPAKWMVLVSTEMEKPQSPFRALREATLWTFVENRDRPALPGREWYEVLRWINDGNSLPFSEDSPDAKILTKGLNARFGEALWEYMKNDFGRGGCAAKAMDLLIAGQLLQRTTAMAKGNEALKEGLADLTRLWRTGHVQVMKTLDELGLRQEWTIALLNAQASTLERLEEKLDAMHAPLLLLPDPDRQAAGQRFVFRNERLEVVGRDEELHTLGQWMDDPRPFSWDLWTGPAGRARVAWH